MPDRIEFWPHPQMNDDAFRFGYEMELRARIALSLIEKYGTVAATPGGEDSAGRAKLVLQEPDALVARCFQIADRFVSTALAEGLIRKPTLSIEEAMATAGRLQAIRHEEETQRWRVPAAERT